MTLKESESRAGGMMRFGIPDTDFRGTCWMPRSSASWTSVSCLELETPVLDLDGDHGGRAISTPPFSLWVPRSGAAPTFPLGRPRTSWTPSRCCTESRDGEKPKLGRRVAVYGGGNTAIDAARSAKRLGAADALVVYRRTRDRMPAHASEVREAEEEGVRFRWLSTINHVDESTIVVEQMELDDTGFPRPTGVTEILEADSVVLALGQEADLSLLASLDQLDLGHGVVGTDAALMTGHPGVFAGGDVTPGERSVTVAIGHGRRAAESIGGWLSGFMLEPEDAVELADFESLNPWYYEDAPRAHRSTLEIVRRQSTFDEVVTGLDPTNALYEARRCMSCGSCISCDNCVAVCPDNAVLYLGMPGEYSIDLDYCKGCGICVAECPCGAIEMVPEQT